MGEYVLDMRVPRISKWLVVVTLTAVGAAAAAGYAVTAPKRYRATAQILVSPVSASDPTFTGLDLLRDSSGKHTAASSAAVLVRSPQIADAVRAQLGVRRSSSELLDELHTRVASGSNVVDVTVEDTSASSAAQLANAFVDALIAQRTSTLQSQLGSLIRRDEQLLARTPSGPQADELGRRLAVLRNLQGQPDPTLRRASTAAAPASASWPNIPLLTGIGAAVGLAAAVLLLAALLLATRARDISRRQYDPTVSASGSDDTVDALVDRLEGRLHARELALAARERDLQTKIEELRSLEGAEAEAALAERERLLEERAELVTRRELEVARRAAVSEDRPDLVGRERELEEREAGLEDRERELGSREPILDEREQQLEERVQAVTKREVEIARRSAEASRLAERERELDERQRQLAERERRLGEREADVEAREPQPPAPVADEPQEAVARPAPPEAANGNFNLGELERLVETTGPRFPDRLEEWRSYLFFLRDYAKPDGSLPESFDWLVYDTFRELLV